MKIALVIYLLLSLLIGLAMPLAIADSSVSIKYEIEEFSAKPKEVLYLEKLYESELSIYEFILGYSLLHVFLFAGLLFFQESDHTSHCIRLVAILLSCLMLVYIACRIYMNIVGIYFAIPSLEVSEAAKEYLVIKSSQQRTLLLLCGSYILMGAIISYLARVPEKLIQKVPSIKMAEA